jgi:hypothetical protein
VVLVSRSAEESLLYMDLQPCPACGIKGFDWAEHELGQSDGGTLISVYAGPCQECGTDRRFEFTLADPAPGAPGFGGPQPSRIIDPGQFVVLARQAASLVPADPATCPADEVDDARQAIATAQQALDEVRKFIPAGADRVPPEAFRSEVGRATYAVDPGQFRLDRLDTVAASYQRIGAAYAALAP